MVWTEIKRRSFMNKYIMYVTLFSALFFTTFFKAESLIARDDSLSIDRGKEHFSNERRQEEYGGGGLYGGYGGVYLAPEQNIDPGQTEFDNSYYEALEHPPEVP
jgi:hypothetical protein